jgi:transcriptional regulator with XRE-family HTH domain
MAKPKPSKEDIFLKKLGERIKYLRKKSGKSLTLFSYELGWDKTNYRQIENGKTNPTTKTLFKISELLGITVSELTSIG